MSELVSECCSAPARDPYEDMGICPDCKEHCEFVDLDEEEEELKKEDLVLGNEYRVKKIFSVSGHDADSVTEFPVGYILIFKGYDGGWWNFESKDGIKIEMWDISYEVGNLEKFSP